MRSSIRNLMAAGLISGLPLMAMASPSESSPAIVQVDNALFVRQFRVTAVRGLPALTQSSIQGTVAQPTVTAYQVTQGSWNGQSLGGLSIVVVAPAGDDSRAHRSVIVSNLATPAQRDALIAAFAASFPDAFGQVSDLDTVQSAMIEVEEIAPRQYVLHIALVA